MKKIFALCLALALLIACLPVAGVLAVGFTGGSGTPATPEAGDITIPITPGVVVPPVDEEELVITDLNDDDKTDTNDAVYLLLSVMFGDEDYPLPVGANVDYDSSEKVDTNDAVYLLLNIMFGEEDYPLYG